MEFNRQRLVLSTSGQTCFLFLGQVQDFTAPSIRILHASRRAKPIDVRHDLGRDACDERKIRMMYVRTENHLADLFPKPLDIIQNLHKHVKTFLNVV